MKWTIEDTRRVIIDLAHRVQQQAYTGALSDYRPGQDLKEDLLLDSVQVMDLSAQVSAFFHLMETSPDNYLLHSSAVDEWAQKCVSGRLQKSERITFPTSGTTGDAHHVTHPQAFIDREVAWLSAFFQGSSCIVSLVPSASIYGYLYTIALPRSLGIPLAFPSEVKWDSLAQNTLIVGTPFTWSHLLRSSPHQQFNARGVCSTAPLSTPLFDEIIGRGVDLTEVYGATETAGVGFRRSPRAPFQLFSYWSLKNETTLLDRESGATIPLMDKLQLREGQTFTVISRQDQKIKVAGQLVDLESVKAQLLLIPGVQNCQLSAKRQVDRTIITAAVALGTDSTEAQQAFLTAMKARLQPAERPTEVHFSGPEHLNKE